jgi:hypothetical protein
VARLPWKHFRTPPEPIVAVSRVVAGPEFRAKEAPKAAKITNSARASLTEMFDMGEKLHDQFRWNAECGSPPSSFAIRRYH